MICALCTHFSQRIDDKMSALGYGCCKHLPVGQYLTPGSVCRIPSEYKKASK